MATVELHDLQHIANQPEIDESHVYGTSPLVFAHYPDKKPARRVKDTLAALAKGGILAPHILDVNPTTLNGISPTPDERPFTALLHANNGAAFVNMAVSQCGRERFFTHTRVYSKGKRGSYESSNSLELPKHDRVRIVSGPCLFSAPTVTAIDEFGNNYAIVDPQHPEFKGKIVDIRVDEKIQPYEVDAILRLTRLISTINPKKEVTVRLNVPRVEYWFYLMDAYDSGLVDSDLLLTWFDKVDERHRRVSQLMIPRIPASFNRQPANVMDHISDQVRQAVREGKRNLFPTIVESLRKSLEWKHALELTTPGSFQELNYIGYTIPYLEDAGRENTLIVAVESPEEVKILENASRLLVRETDQATIVGIYPHTNVIMRDAPAHGNGKRFLYFLDAASNHFSLVRQVHAANKRK